MLLTNNFAKVNCLNCSITVCAEATLRNYMIIKAIILYGKKGAIPIKYIEFERLNKMHHIFSQRVYIVHT